ncbi:MAG: cysteine--tRNA ligase [Halobacteriaceae archaeon]
MTLSVTDTRSGEQEAFTVDDDEVLLYVCGLTVSDDPHLGHARLWVQADVLHRWLEYLGYSVRHVENITDVNEKIVAHIDERGLGDSEPAVAQAYLEEVLAGMRGLNLLRATVYPRVSEHIPEIIDLVETLVEQGHAYEANGSVYFDVTTFDRYGDLSNQDLEELDPQGPEAELAEKRHPQDFALWKADGVDPSAIEDHRDGPVPTDPPTGQTWASPWGPGRPGWHVECSAMAMTHLGETIDIHMGGRDLVFPHHENEIAQSEAATGQEFARYWLHNGLLETKGEKMSSSLGNFTTVADALEEYGVNVVRTFYLGAAYRSDQTLSASTMAEAEQRWERLRRAHADAVAACDSVDARTKAEDERLRAAVEDARSAFETAMNDDLNVREAMTALLELATAVHRHLDDGSPYDYQGLRRSVETFETFGEDVFGLQFGTVTDGVADLAEELVELVLEVRAAEREAGNYERADDLRADLEALGVDVEDTPDGPEYSL